ncbi:MAG: Mut7-C RNAse domain-containing protein [bacterium]|nr:Mut7-C RNAse domain-containing protein [bacterium]
MKFLADSMLGKLAKWLRILGFDTAYYNSVSDKNLIEIAEEEERILITRDKQLSRCWVVSCLYIKSESIDEQLHQIVKYFNLDIKETLGKFCPLCNEVLKEVEKKEIKLLVPELVYSSYKNFWKCLKCNKIYWEGTHWENIKKKVKELKGEN